MPTSARPDLDQATANTRRGRGAEAAQRGDGAGSRVQPGAHAVGDADAADQQRGQADQRHEQAGLVDEPGHPRRGVVRVADAPALIGECRAQFGGQVPTSAPGRQRGAERVAAPWSRGATRPVAGSASGGISTRGPNMQRRGDAVGFGGQRAADGEAGVAQADGVAGCEAQAVEHNLARRAGPELAVRAQPVRPTGAVGGSILGRADQRPGGIDRLQFHQLPLAGRRDQHGAHLHDVRQPSRRARAASRAARPGSGCEPLSTSRSPPRMRRPSVGQPAFGRRRSVPTAAITATPRARQSSTIHSRANPAAQFPRARRNASIRRSVRPRPQSDRFPPPARRRCGSAASNGPPALGIVGDQHQRGAGPARSCEQQVHHRLAGRLVQVAGRLVGQQQPRPRREGTGQRHALLLAAGELARAGGSADAPARPHRSASRRSGRRRRGAGQLQRHRDVLQRGHRRDQVERLEHDADSLAPQPGQRVLVQRVTFPPGQQRRCRQWRAPARPAPSAGWSCPSRRDRRCRPPRPARYRDRCRAGC